MDKMGQWICRFMGMTRQQFTTQIEHYDSLAAHFDCMKKLIIFSSLCRDIWSYVSMEYFKQKTKKGEVGSLRCHTSKPDRFWECRRNLGMANAIFEHLSAKCRSQDWQRDLTDSTVLRNYRLPGCAHHFFRWSKRVWIDREQLQNHRILTITGRLWPRRSKTILRRENYPNPMKRLKNLTRGPASLTKSQSFFIIVSNKWSCKKRSWKNNSSNYTRLILLRAFKINMISKNFHPIN